MLESILSVRPVEIIDLAVVWLLVWAGITWLRETPARLALAGLGILLAFYFVARQLGLVLTTWILQGFAAVVVLVAVVVFQQELRRLFEQIAAFGMGRRALAADQDVIDMISRAVNKLADDRRGALIVFPGRESPAAHIEGGLTLDAQITAPLLLSIFDPNSPGHDGAVTIKGDRLDSFMMHLPLSTDYEQLAGRGTRHAAALGLAERTDALCIAVSEERGTVSVARDGQLQTLNSPREVAHSIRLFQQEQGSTHDEPSAPWTRVTRRWREAAAALPIAAVLWSLAVPGATIIEFERTVPIAVAGLPPGYVIDQVDPPQARVHLAAMRRDIYFLAKDAIDVQLDAILVDMGRRTFAISTDNVRRPDGVEVRSLEPTSVRISLQELTPPATEP